MGQDTTDRKDRTVNRKKESKPGDTPSAAAPALVIAPGSQPWAQRLGPLAWTTLQHLALASQATDNGRAAAVGVRDIAAGIGVTKDTAARAVSALINGGLVIRGRVESTGGGRRSGYLLRLPETLSLIDSPQPSDIPARRPVVERGACLLGASADLDAGSTHHRPTRPDDRPPPARGASRRPWDQPELFASPGSGGPTAPAGAAGVAS
jgi:hypothetical protein